MYIPLCLTLIMCNNLFILPHDLNFCMSMDNRMGRDMAYDCWSCDLLCAASSPDLYRINLEQVIILTICHYLFWIAGWNFCCHFVPSFHCRCLIKIRFVYFCFTTDTQLQQQCLCTIMLHQGPLAAKCLTFEYLVIKLFGSLDI